MSQPSQLSWNFDTRRFRSYILRIPLATRLVLLVSTAFFIAGLFLPWLSTWAALTPQEIALTSGMYRLNTFPFLHLGFFHFLVNMIAFIPLLDRFEAEVGTLVTFILFTGPFATLPGGIYTLIERFVYHSNTSVQGASIWVFMLLANEAIKTYRANPYFEVSTLMIPTWTTPLILNVFIAFIVPRSSFTGHMCGLAIGYLWGLGYIRFLAPSEKILRWIENKLNPLGRLPHYVSVDQKVYGRYGVLPSTSTPRVPTLANGAAIGLTSVLGGTQRLGP